MAPKTTVVLATRNKGKIAELAGPLLAFGVSVVGLDAFPNLQDIEEDGVTFEENALFKARTVAAATGLVAIADDSGLSVDALAGAPGVHSARYADDLPAIPGESRDERNIRKLLEALVHVLPKDRTGRFHCVMAAARPSGDAITAEGIWEGHILTACRGANGFGYDPVFLDPESGRTAAELSREEKMAVSHRARALKKLLESWPAFWKAC